MVTNACDYIPAHFFSSSPLRDIIIREHCRPVAFTKSTFKTLPVYLLKYPLLSRHYRLAPLTHTIYESHQLSSCLKLTPPQTLTTHAHHHLSQHQHQLSQLLRAAKEADLSLLPRLLQSKLSIFLLPYFECAMFIKC